MRRVNTTPYIHPVRMFLGIDQSYTKLGICVLDADGELVHYSVFATDKTLDIYDRATEAAAFICSIVDDYKISTIGIEGLAFGKFGNATRDLAGLLFTIITSIRRVCTSVPAVHILAPTSIKKLATGSGKAGKQDMIDHLPKMVHHTFLQTHKKTTGLQDLADAYWIAVAAKQNTDNK